MHQPVRRAGIRRYNAGFLNQVDRGPEVIQSRPIAEVPIQPVSFFRKYRSAGGTVFLQMFQPGRDLSSTGALSRLNIHEFCGNHQIALLSVVWIEAGNLRWRGGRLRYEEASKSMLSDFVRLIDAKSVLRFAERWGVLRLAGKKIAVPGTASLASGREPIKARFITRVAHAQYGISRPR